MPFPFIPSRWRRRARAELASFSAGSSSLRRLIGQATSGEYRSFESLAAAQAATSVWAVLDDAIRRVVRGETRTLAG